MNRLVQSVDTWISPESHNCSSLKINSVSLKPHENAFKDLPSSQSLFPDRSNIKIQLKTTDTNPVTIKTASTKSTSALDKLKSFFKSNEKSSKKPVSNATKRIIELSKMKSTARGDVKVPQTERIYIWAQVIDDSFDKTLRNPIFISRGWPIGRALDSIAQTLKIKNINNKTNDSNEKLFLFKNVGNSTFMKLNTADRCNTIKDGDTIYIVRDKSAPEKFLHLSSCAIVDRSTSESTGVLLMFMTVFKISNRSFAFGNSMNKVLSNLPGLNMAGSIISGLLVAPMTNIPFLSFNPSNSVNRVLTTLDELSLKDVSLLGTNASNSSKKMTQGMEALALVNT
ncbi:hypothetical protein WICMUC_003968 [Wickerhamomyces mucosus]|uniref:ZFAND1-like ubiquitin-like domain-containing protein n=1 Tax=Wickerhamomyces mucosus TaxID=1378264 RepID=A0A9P8PK63_9ASCO|nr:hypothetical protein WICMUC_003968 [Wickerhamomyces mucosus]